MDCEAIAARTAYTTAYASHVNESFRHPVIGGVVCFLAREPYLFGQQLEPVMSDMGVSSLQSLDRS